MRHIDADDFVQGDHPGLEHVEPDRFAPLRAQLGDLFLEDFADMRRLGDEGFFWIECHDRHTTSTWASRNSSRASANDFSQRGSSLRGATCLVMPACMISAAHRLHDMKGEVYKVHPTSGRCANISA